MTAKTFREKGHIDCTRGVSREQRAINRRNKLEFLTGGWSDGTESPRAIKRMLKAQKEQAAVRAYLKQERATWEKRYGALPDRAPASSSFVEKPFGSVITNANDTSVFPCVAVSLALFDGDKMLFACSGIPLPDPDPSQVQQTRFVTSARLATEFKNNRYKDDELRVEVRLPNDETFDGLLGLYDEDIAIVTSLCLLDVHHIDPYHPMDLRLPARYVCDDDHVLAIGCAFESGCLMAARGSLCSEHPCMWVPDTQDLTEAVIGGPLIGNGGRFLGMNHKHHGDASVTFLRQEFLRERLEHFQIFNRNKDFRGYSLPKGVKRIEPSGFSNTFNWIKSCGYPMPPPLVLELNGELLNRFEEYFGDIIAWRGFPFGLPPESLECGVWKRLPKKIVTDVSRRVVSVASFEGDERFFACTGLLINWPFRHAVVLTSASLVRSRQNENDIDSNLNITVFLPRNEVSGTLEWYDLNYNIAIVSVKKSFPATRPENIFDEVKESSREVVAIGRDPEYGLLMASYGRVMNRKKDAKLDCRDVLLSTCKIKKAGIGGPLINLHGEFVGMNFYDGREVTPFLPRIKIVEVLESVLRFHELPSQSGMSGQAIPFEGSSEKREKNKWPVPEPYWYHGFLEVDMYEVPELRGRHLETVAV